MDQPSPRPLIRPERPDDHDAIGSVVAAAFGSDAEAALVERIRASPEYRPELALVAELDGVVVGHVMISATALHHDAGVRTIVMLSPLAVAPEHQGGGIGGQLVDAAVVGADRLGEPVVVLEGSPHYYGRLGFEPAARHGISLPIPDWAPPEAAQVRLLDRYDPTDATLRGAVVYPAAFDALE